jgi:hypothetical protein
MPNVNQISGANYPLTAADGGGGGVAWTNVSNALLEDGSLSTSGLIGPGGGGGIPNQLKLTNFAFNLPSNAVIDGIKLETKVDGGAGNTDIGYINLVYNGGATTPANTPNIGQNWFGGLRYLTYGSSSSLWGRTWTAAEINHANFGAAIAAQLNTGTGTVSVDTVRITVYWHYSVDVSAADVPKRYLYKMSDPDSNYLGVLPNVLSEFSFPQDINSAGSSINIEVGISPDTAALDTDYLVTESGDKIITESGEYLRLERKPDALAVGTNTDPFILIRNGNKVAVYEYSYYYPNGKLMFTGQINRIEAAFGGDGDDKMKMTVISDGQDLDNLVARGAPFTYTADVSQTSQNTYVTVSQESKGSSWNRYGQTWATGVGITNIGAITLLLQGAANVTVTVQDGLNGTVLGSVTQAVDTAGAITAIQFAMANLITSTAATSYFLAVSVDGGQSINVYCSSANPYANGQMYLSSYGGGGGGGYSVVSGYDLYFVTATGLATTTATYTSKDPSTEMLKPIIDDYRLRGGLINYASGTVDATALSITYTFNTNTILEALKAIASLAPNGFYWWVDLGTNTLYFKNASTTADITLVRGKHLKDINLVMSIENVKNQMLFSGGPTAGVNLYKQYQDQTSISRYGIRLERKSDNRVTIANTADAIGSSFVSENKNETYETTVTVMDRTMDITTLTPGKIIGLRGFGTFMDSITMQIVRREYHPEYVVLTLGVLPVRMNDEVEQTTRGLIAEQTVANPTTPS